MSCSWAVLFFIYVLLKLKTEILLCDTLRPAMSCHHLWSFLQALCPSCCWVFSAWWHTFCLSCVSSLPMSALNILNSTFSLILFRNCLKEIPFHKSKRTHHHTPSLNAFPTPWKALHLIALKYVVHLLKGGICCHFCQSSSNRLLDTESPVITSLQWENQILLISLWISIPLPGA